jgi:hypothetical protein
VVVVLSIHLELRVQVALVEAELEQLAHRLPVGMELQTRAAAAVQAHPQTSPQLSMVETVDQV